MGFIMRSGLNQLFAELDRDERGSVSIETVGMIALACVVLFALGNMVGTGTGAGQDSNTLIGTMFDFSKKVLVNWTWK
jgi:hypothetical protein